MALILNIDTALQTASVCLSKDGVPLAFEESTTQNQHASWLHTSIKNILVSNGTSFYDIDAIAVSNGPGSYTGLRIGLSTAKGICYASNIPLICISTLTIMASSVAGEATDIICPMIDARRMEVFTALYDKELNIVTKPFALKLQQESFHEVLSDHKILFTGDGAIKFEDMITDTNAIFVQRKISALNMLPLAEEMYANARYADLAYSEPEYVKAVYTTSY